MSGPREMITGAAALLAAATFTYPIAAQAQTSGAPAPPAAMSYGSAYAAAPAPAPPPAKAPAEPPQRHYARRAVHRSAEQAALHDAEVRSTETPHPQEFVNAILHYGYEPGKLYTIRTAPGFLTAIALRPGERLISKAAGDTVRWEVGETTQGTGSAPQTVILIKPLDAGLVTNMILTTDQRTYVLDLVSGAAGDDHTTLVDWRYPADEMRELQISRAAATVQSLAAQASALPGSAGLPTSPFITPAGAPAPAGPGRLAGPSDAHPALLPTGDVAPASLNFNYRIEPLQMRHAPAWTPQHVFDDGRKTYVKFPENISTVEIPPLFMIGPKGEAELINYRFQNGYYIVDRLFSVAELRLGSSDQQVVRIAYQGAAR